ncbi:family 20 glycosylhydrolase [Candidatus Spyradosoma sp. SGI.093]|uniref:family 20 glycosylhydrolase n=1 Tax=Candidatus Spyradosoma sp. SGI.093 TaxID=3420583 RepID=UPI003D0644CF
MKDTTLAAALAALALAGFAGAENLPFGAVPALAQDAAAAPAVSVAELAKAFSPENNLDLSGETLAYRNLPAGVSAKIVGTTYEQLVGFDGKIRRPISPKTTKLTFALSDASGATAQTATFEVAVPVDANFAKAPAVAARNAKPAVVPALQEWFGGEGAFVPAEDFAVVVPASVADVGEPSLRERAELFAAELSEIFGREVPVLDKARGGKADIVLIVAPENPEIAFLGKEGYGIASVKDALVVAASDPLGAFWGTRTILQVFRRHENTFPCGFAVDYPQYPLRGFMYDVGRKPASLKAVRDVMRTMSYYKLNDFQLHLNDNYIWLHEYTATPNGKDASAEQKSAAAAEVLAAAPTAFRLESDVVGKDGTPLTAPDHFYTKKEFGVLMDEAKLYGVNIVPELDVPGHAMSFVRVRPELMYRGAVTKPHDVERTAMLDASDAVFDPATGRTFREETLAFVQSVFDEYLLPGKNGEPPVFRDAVVHIGTDEYYGNAEDYRAFADAMLKYVKSRGRTPRLWGSLSVKKGKTPVDGTGAQIDVWNLGWQDPNLALEHGFDLVNIVDATSYVVPNGIGNVGGYGDLLNLPRLYSQTWHPHTFDFVGVVPGMPKMLGAQWALWNDNSFRRDKGLTDFDLFDRIRKSCAVFAEKTWNSGEDASYRDFMRLVKAVAFPPLTNPEYSVKNAAGEAAFELAEPVPAGESVATGFAGFAPDYVAEFRVKRVGESVGAQTIFSGPAGTFLAVRAQDGKVGITRDTWSYAFDYALPVDREVALRLVAKNRTLTLFADGVEIGSPVRDAFPESHKYSTFVFPLETIGAAGGNVEIASLKIARIVEPGTEDAVPADEIRGVSASSEHGKGADGDASALVDEDTDTYWHSRYAPTRDAPPFEIVVELAKPTALSGFAFLPRQSGDNGNVKRAELFAKNGDGAWEKVSEFADENPSRALKKIAFASPRTATALKLVILDGVGGYGTLAEIYPLRAK